MMRITADHLARVAIVYIRQSTQDQVLHNRESQRRQYGLVDRARALGWEQVEVIDDDLGRSGSGIARPGFEKLLAAICAGRVGAVVSIEASRLARNGRDWHTLLEFCGLVGTLILDEEGIYDARLPNDRLLLGMKGTMSEMELSILRQRSQEALRQKAQRGELFMTVAVGYERVGNDKIQKHPDRRLQAAIMLVFQKFAEFQSVRQVHLWLRQEHMTLPAAVYGPEGRTIVWKLPVYNTVLHILNNPIYAGAYAFGRTGSQVVIEDGRKKIGRGLRRDRSDWQVLIRDHHEGYIDWPTYERNQRLIADNATGHAWMSRGAVRRGEALLAGLLRCGHCGRKLHVAYSGTNGSSGRYHCRGSQLNHGGSSCISFGGMRVDREVGAEVIRRLQPLGVEAAVAAAAAQTRELDEKRQHLTLALTQARYEASRAGRQYDGVDPENRLVAGELELRWNQRLQAVAALERELEELAPARDAALSAADRDRLLQLGADLEQAWHSDGATAATRKKILRMVIREIVVRVDGVLDLVIHWEGGDHTSLQVQKNKSGQHRWTTAADTVDLVKVLARQMPDKSITALLNRAGKKTGRGNSWTAGRVRALRDYHHIPVYREGERAERAEVTLDEAAAILKVSPSTIRRLIATDVLPASQLCKGAPWIIKSADLDRDEVKNEAAARRLRRPSSQSPDQITLQLQ